MMQVHEEERQSTNEVELIRTSHLARLLGLALSGDFICSNLHLFVTGQVVVFYRL